MALEAHFRCEAEQCKAQKKDVNRWILVLEATWALVDNPAQTLRQLIVSEWDDQLASAPNAHTFCGQGHALDFISKWVGEMQTKEPANMKSFPQESLRE